MLDTNEMLDFFNDWNNDPELSETKAETLDSSVHWGKITYHSDYPSGRIKQHLTELKAEDNTYITFANIDSPEPEALATQRDFDELQARILELSNTIDEMKTSSKYMVATTEHIPRKITMADLQKEYGTDAVIGVDMAKEYSDVTATGWVQRELNPGVVRGVNSCDFIDSNAPDQISDVQKLKDEKLTDHQNTKSFNCPQQIDHFAELEENIQRIKLEKPADEIFTMHAEALADEFEKKILQSFLTNIEKEKFDSFDHAMALVS